MKNPPSYAIASVDHALRLAVMLQVEGPLGVSDAAERLGVARSTAHRLLSMLAYRDFAVQRSDRRYAVGPVLAVGHSSDRSRTAHLRAAAMPWLAALMEEVQESANVQVLTGEHCRFVGAVECRQALRVGDREGMAFPAHKVSGGKVLLAELSTAELSALYSAERFADRPEELPNVASLRQELSWVRRRGYAINIEGAEKGVVGIGRPLRLGAERAEAAVCVSLPTVRFDDERVRVILGALTRAAVGIEADFVAQRPGGLSAPADA
ncbi:IclR family transcriptional regulator [Flexivirga sp. ID2601S]|uniref:IclR family transcriptional regulator n=1 Tax=Flexivirga aerilata TaxID=1656889 RepID=A0A849AIG1_9MICO|nr:IclR family transcriptional regulator [Flexivirga aerilata]NNG39111.1 IclR family transcriptional regulator [Flexivirga aerilata]